jgi:predicted transcriptional regulator
MAARKEQTRFSLWQSGGGQLRVFHQNPPDAHTAFRLPKELLAKIDTICEELDLTRSQLFRRSIAEYIKEWVCARLYETMKRTNRLRSYRDVTGGVQAKRKDLKRRVKRNDGSRSTGDHMATPNLANDSASGGFRDDDSTPRPVQSVFLFPLPD